MPGSKLCDTNLPELIHRLICDWFRSASTAASFIVIHSFNFASSPIQITVHFIRNVDNFTICRMCRGRCRARLSPCHSCLFSSVRVAALNIFEGIFMQPTKVMRFLCALFPCVGLHGSKPTVELGHIIPACIPRFFPSAQHVPAAHFCRCWCVLTHRLPLLPVGSRPYICIVSVLGTRRQHHMNQDHIELALLPWLCTSLGHVSSPKRCRQ
jgi:hypothetical protein